MKVDLGNNEFMRNVCLGMQKEVEGLMERHAEQVAKGQSPDPGQAISAILHAQSAILLSLGSLHAQKHVEQMNASRVQPVPMILPHRMG